MVIDRFYRKFKTDTHADYRRHALFCVFFGSLIMQSPLLPKEEIVSQIRNNRNRNKVFGALDRYMSLFVNENEVLVIPDTYKDNAHVVFTDDYFRGVFEGEQRQEETFIREIIPILEIGELISVMEEYGVLTEVMSGALAKCMEEIDMRSYYYFIPFIRAGSVSSEALMQVLDSVVVQITHTSFNKYEFFDGWIDLIVQAVATDPEMLVPAIKKSFIFVD